MCWHGRWGENEVEEEREEEGENGAESKIENKVELHKRKIGVLQNVGQVVWRKREEEKKRGRELREVLDMMNEEVRNNVDCSASMQNKYVQPVLTLLYSSKWIHCLISFSVVLPFTLTLTLTLSRTRTWVLMGSCTICCPFLSFEHFVLRIMISVRRVRRAAIPRQSPVMGVVLNCCIVCRQWSSQ